MRSLGRALLLGVSASLLTVVSLSAASAGELDEVLKEASDSTYTASRLVVSVWGGQTQVTREFVEHADGMEMVRRDTTWSMAGRGKAVSMGPEPTGVTFVSDPTAVESDRYTIIERSKAQHMSRPCRVIEVMEGEIVRATLVVDDRSGALLIEELYGGNGDLYRRTTLSDFKAYRTYEAPMDETDMPMEVVMHADADLLPEMVGAYRLVDAFGAPGESEQGLYGDGLFRFSLFILSKDTVVSGFEDPMVFATEAGAYDMVPTAHSVRLRWSDGSNQFVLVGDLPPDHVAEVLAGLPEPSSTRMWSRLWNRLFG